MDSREGLVTFMCRNCSYHGIGMDDLNNHIMQEHVTDNDISHENNENTQIICDLCNKHVWTKRELTNHVNSDHKSNKPCHYFKEELREKKYHGMFFAANLIFLLPLDNAVDKMSVSHAKEICKLILTLILFQISDWGFS